MPVQKMTVAQWIKVPANPIQRDTERHAAKAKHLLTPLPIHAITYAARLPNGSLVKLDGHTRALLWSRNQVKHPPEIECNVIDVDGIGEAVALYKTLDSKDALETVTDKVSGAYRNLNFTPKSGLVARGSLASALKIAWTSLHGFAAEKQAKDVYEMVEEFSNEIFALDAMEIGVGGAQSGVVAAFFMTHRKYAEKVIPFWTSVFGNGGTKIDGRMDGVQAINEMLLSRKGLYGSSAARDICARSVMAAEKWLRDEDFGAIPRPYDIANYIAGKSPRFSLIKQKSAA